MSEDFSYVFAAFVINTFAVIVALSSLYWSKSWATKSSTSTGTSADQLMVYVGIVWVVSFLLLVLQREAVQRLLPILTTRGFNFGLDKPWIIRLLAVADYWLLYSLIGSTGGPTQSWFTPFLLAIVPVVIMLGEDPYLCLLYLMVTIILFLILLKRSPDARNGFEAKPWGYEICYGTTSGLTVIFPLAIKIMELLWRR